MSQTINIDRFTRLNQTIEGNFLPRELSGLAEYLAGEGGEINYSLTGRLEIALSGSQVRRVKCIIYGCFLLFDPVTLATVQHTLDINSSLILVEAESDLPPLEMESESEDYIVCGSNMDVAGRVEEEILLSLPAHAVRKSGVLEKRTAEVIGIGETSKKAKISGALVPEGKKISPFAKLAKLKNSNKV
jgi:hypothetical protein